MLKIKKLKDVYDSINDSISDSIMLMYYVNDIPNCFYVRLTEQLETSLSIDSEFINGQIIDIIPSKIFDTELTRIGVMLYDCKLYLIPKEKEDEYSKYLRFKESSELPENEEIDWVNDG